MTLGNATAESQRTRQVQGPAFVGCSVRAELLKPAFGAPTMSPAGKISQRSAEHNGL